MPGKLGGFILEIPYGLFQLFSTVLPNNHCLVCKISQIDVYPLILHHTCGCWTYNNGQSVTMEVY